MEPKSDMYGQSRLQKRGSVYYFRAMIPKDLRRHYGRREIVYSLKTKDYAEARRLAREASWKLDQEFEAVRAPDTPPRGRLSVLTDENVRTICDTWRHQCLDTDAWYRSHGLSDTEYEQRKSSAEETIETLREVLAKGRLERIEPAIRQFLGFIGVEFCGGPEDMRRLAWSILETMIDTHLAIMARDQGEMVPTPPAPKPLRAQPSRLPTNAGEGAAPTLTDCFDHWKQAVTDRPAKTVSDFEGVLDDFTARVGDKVVTALTSGDVYGYIEYLLEERQLDPGTVEKRLSYLRAIYNAGARRLQLPPGPFSGIRVPKPRVRKVKRLPYDSADLARIFASPVYTDGKRPRAGGGDAAAWLPLLSLFTGARVEELAQLQVHDVAEEGGIAYLDITDLDNQRGDAGTADKRLKTTSSRRKVPIHPQLIEAGFLRYVAQMRERNAIWLFPGLKPDCHGKRSGNFSKWWARYRRQVIGIDSRLKPFHSFRHTFRDACREAELGEELADAFMGHASDKTGRGYGQGFSLKVLHRAMQRIEYPALTIPVILPA